MTLQTSPRAVQHPAQLCTREADFEAEAMPFSRDLYRTALRMLQDPGKAADAVQETYLLAWKSFDRYERGTNCRAWLYTILFNVVRQERRTWFKWMTGRDEDAAGTVLAAPASIPTELSDQDILAALDRIPSQFRAVVLMVDVEEFSYKATSEMLKVPVGTVMSRLSRGRGLLREELVGVAKSYRIGTRDGQLTAK